jgi:hypothetical protein
MGKDVGKVLSPSVHPHMIKPVPLQLFLQLPVLNFFPGPIFEGTGDEKIQINFNL